MKKSQRKPLKDKSSNKCYNKSKYNASDRSRSRATLRDNYQEKQDEKNFEFLPMLTQGLLML